MQGSKQERFARTIAWLVVVLVHAGIFWLLSTQRSLDSRTHDEPRLRLLWLVAPDPPKPPPAPAPRALQASAA